MNWLLVLPEHAAQFTSTLLHEMAHVVAWVGAGDRGHGRPWRLWAMRVGTRPTACARGVRLVVPAQDRLLTAVPELVLETNLTRAAA